MQVHKCYLQNKHRGDIINLNITRTNPHTHAYPCCYLNPKSLGCISICIHIQSVRAAKLPATPMKSNYQSIWTVFSSNGTGPKSHFTLSTSCYSVHHAGSHALSVQCQQIKLFLSISVSIIATGLVIDQF